MFFVSKRNYNRWTYWRQKKLVFCLLSGVVYALFTLLINITYRWFFNTTDMWETSAGVSIGSFVAGSFFSLAIWFENERRYKSIENT